MQAMECDEIVKLVGTRIRSVRKGKKLSQESLAEMSGLHPVYISNVELGKLKASICTYNSIAEALGMSLAELVEMPGEKESWDNNLLSLFQAAKHLSQDKQKIFTEAARGVLRGLGDI